jgi:RNA 3'-phosphate cyclase
MEGPDQRMTVIDGSYGEGGGQILRTSLALAALLKKPVTIHHIRAKREKPGLRPQHLKGVEALAQITGARVEGARLGSDMVTYHPGDTTSGNFKFEVGNGRKSAGSVTLLLQAFLLPLCLGRGRTELTLMGGTHVPWSPPFHFFSEVLCPALQAFGISVRGRLDRWGWYPRGGGIVRAEIDSISELKPIALVERGQLNRIRGLSASSSLPRHVVERQRDHAIRKIRDEIGREPEIELTDQVPGEGPGSFLFLVVESEKARAGFSSLGARGKRAEKVAEEAVDALREYWVSGACVDSHLADQLLPFMAVAKGTSSFTTHRVTDHLITNLWVIQQFVNAKVSLQGEKGSKGKVDLTPIE